MKKIIIILFLSLTSCKTTTPNSNIDSLIEITMSAGDNAVTALVAEDASSQVYELMSNVKNTVVAGDLRKALESYVNPIIEIFEQEYKKKYPIMHSPRTQQESLFYTLEGLLLSAVKGTEKKQVNIYRVPYVFSEAYYLRGSLNISLGRLDLGKEALEQALALAPSNSLFLSELGYIYQAENKFAEAIEIYEKALSGADFSPETQKNIEKGRALRGVGYSLIELKRLEEAEMKYLQALKIDPNDPIALNELKYIKKMRQNNL